MDDILGHYILKGHRPVKERDILKWAEWIEDGTNQRVAETFIENIRISTVFLGINHNFTGGVPLLFETMIFGGKLNGEMLRTTTWKNAEDNHKVMVMRVAKSLRKKVANEKG